MSENSPLDSYNSISKPSSGSYRDLGSKFLSFAYPVSDEEEVKELLESIKREYHDARHHCYAYRIGLDGELWRANDDGEPSSSAGRPILGQLLSYQLSDIVIFVVRYFGGTKLGIPGLIRAYRAAAKEAIESAQIVEKRVLKRVIFSFDYIAMEPVMRLLKSFELTFINQEYLLRPLFELSIRASQYDSLLNSLLEIEGVTIEKKREL